MVSTCCGLMSLQKASIVTGTLETICAAVFLVLNSITLIVETPLAIEERERAEEEPDPYRFHGIRVALCALNTSMWVCCIFLGMILVAAAKRRDLRRLRMWFILTCILTVVFSVDILMEAFCMTAPVLAIVSPTVGTLLQGYMLWIVTGFMEEVARGGCALPVKTDIDDYE